MTGGIHREPAELAEGPAFAEHSLRVKGERADLIAAEQEADPFVLIEVLLLVLVAGWVQHDEDAILGLVVGESNSPDMPLRLDRLTEPERGIARPVTPETVSALVR